MTRDITLCSCVDNVYILWDKFYVLREVLSIKRSVHQSTVFCVIASFRLVPWPDLCHTFFNASKNLDRVITVKNVEIQCIIKSATRARW